MLVLFVGITGFGAEIALYVESSIWGVSSGEFFNPGQTSTLARVLLLSHIVSAMDLIAFVGITKFAHVIFRPVALWLYGSQVKIEAEQEV